MNDNVKVVQFTYKPRRAFKAFHARHQRRAVLVCHRRFGKTYGLVEDLGAKALRFNRKDRFGKKLKNPRFAYVCPRKNQAKGVAWDYLKAFAAAIPGHKINEAELYVEFTCASGERARITIYGADDPESLRGLYFDGIVLDEYGDMKKSLYESVVSIALTDRQGWVVFSGTPKGKNDFYKRVEDAIKDPANWFYLNVKVSTNPQLDPTDPDYDPAWASAIDELREELDSETLEQEFECSFEASFKGTFYADAMGEIMAQRRIHEVKYDSSEPVHVAMDIGRSDALAVIFFQYVNGRLNIFDYLERTGWHSAKLSQYLQMQPWHESYGTIWMPHDAAHETFATEKSIIDQFIDDGFQVRMAKKPDKGNRRVHGIDEVRKVLSLWPVHIDNTGPTNRLIDCLKYYRRKFSRTTETFTTEPEHDQWSHGADAMRYLCCSVVRGDLEASKDRHRRREVLGAERALNTSRLTLEEAFRARERQMLAVRSNPGSAYD